MAQLVDPKTPEWMLCSEPQMKSHIIATLSAIIQNSSQVLQWTHQEQKVQGPDSL